MKLRNFLSKAMLLASVAIVGFSCSDDKDNYDYYSDVYGDLSNANGAYILNSGSYGSNDATLSFYNTDSASVSTSVFAAQNSGENLGDTGQDMFIYGSKMYIAMYGSGLIYVTDKNGNLENTITSTKNSSTQYPRSLAAYNGYIYVTYYDGYVGRIDTTNTSEIDAEVAVGANPEGLAISNGKIFVANSGGMNYPDYDSTVTVIDIKTFTVKKTITVTINPTVVKADNDGNVFVVSMGNYSDVPNTLQRINSDYSVDSIGNATMIALSADEKDLYCIYSQYDASWNQTFSFFSYNISSQTVESDPFVSSTASALFAYDPYSMSVNPNDGNVYIGASDYSSEGKMYVVNPSTGSLVSSFSTGGINPQGAFFLVK